MIPRQSEYLGGDRIKMKFFGKGHHFSAATIILVFSVVVAQAQECPDLQDYLAWVQGATLPDRPSDVAVSGDYAYAAVKGLGLQVISIGDPLNPEEVSTVGSLPTANSIAVVADLAYVLTWDDGLHIIDVSLPDTPSPLGSVSLVSWSWEVVVSGSYAYVGAESGAFSVIDVSDPTSPEVVGSSSAGGPIQGLAVSGNFVYLAVDMSGLQVVDVGDPANPIFAGSVGIQGSPRKVAVSGGHAYVAVTGDGLQIIDISDPMTPQLAGSVETPTSAWDVAVSGSYAYVACGDFDPEFHTGSLEVINISNAAAPFLEGSLASENGLSSVTLTGNFAITNPGVYDPGAGQIVGNLAMAWVGCEPVSAVPVVPGAASIPVLHQNVPNPFNPHTTISFDLPRRAAVSLQVYDVSGRLVDVILDHEVVPQGRNDILWRGRDMREREISAGVYFYHLESENFSETKRLVLVR